MRSFNGSFSAAEAQHNDHATLIGLIVSWWNRRADNSWAVETGPSIGTVQGNQWGACDALLCDSSGPAVVLEVEGSKFDYTLEKIGKCLVAPLEDLTSIRAGILIAYGYEPKGQGGGRIVPLLPVKKFLNFGIKLTRPLKNKKLIIITVDKKYEGDAEGIRRRNDYYRCAVSSIKGYKP